MVDFKSQATHREGRHAWGVAHCACDLSVEPDALVEEVAALLRAAYGERQLLDVFEIPEPDPSVGQTFDVQSILRAFRDSLPDPDDPNDQNKPARLRHARSEPAEIFAGHVLNLLFNVRSPTSPQRAKLNANQPILGFDGWGLLDEGGATPALVFVFVKATEEDAVPARVADALVAECRAAPSKHEDICRALMVMLQLAGDASDKTALLRMLEELGQNKLPRLFVAPVLVRGGGRSASIEDLEPLRSAADAIIEASSLGVAVSIGVDLLQFGLAVLRRARAA